MADDRWSTWQAEQAGTSSGPSAGAALALFAILALVLALALAGDPTATAQGGDDRRPPTLCAEHRGEPAWDAICAETARRHRR